MLHDAQDPLYRLSTFVAELHGQAETDSVDGLMRWAVEELSGIVNFDCAWFGWAEVLDSSVWVKASDRFNLPDSYHASWLEMSEQDLLAAALIRDPDRVAVYHRAQRRQTEGMAALADRYGLTRMATAMNHRAPGPTAFYISAYRGGRRAPDWTPLEQSFLRSAADQIGLAMRRCRIADLAEPPGAIPLLINAEGFILMGLNRLRAAEPAAAAAAFADERVPLPLDWLETGSLLLREAGLVLSAWPSAPGLPAGVRPVLARRMEPVDELSAREREVALQLARGRSHKEAARALGVAPATIRNHTQAIYAKLEIDNRASLTALMHGRLTGRVAL